MTWKSHGALNGVVVWVVTHDIEWTVGGFLFSCLPDWLECGVLPHRAITHILSCWAFAAAVAFLTGNQYAEIIAVGCLLHLAADAFSETGIPIWPWNPLSYDWKAEANRIRIPCYKTGQLSEFVFLLAVFAVVWLFWIAGGR
jgi:hypothetical protein